MHLHSHSIRMNLINPLSNITTRSKILNAFMKLLFGAACSEIEPKYPRKVTMQVNAFQFYVPIHVFVLVIMEMSVIFVQQLGNNYLPTIYVISDFRL